jgi:hypothetical protein
MNLSVIQRLIELITMKFKKKKFRKVVVSAVFENQIPGSNPVSMVSSAPSPLALDSVNRDLHQPPIRDLFEYFGLEDEIDTVKEELGIDF